MEATPDAWSWPDAELAVEKAALWAAHEAVAAARLPGAAGHALVVSSICIGHLVDLLCEELPLHFKVASLVPCMRSCRAPSELVQGLSPCTLAGRDRAVKGTGLW